MRPPAGRGAATECAMPAITLPTSRASPSSASPSSTGVTPCGPGQLGRGLQAELRGGDQPGLGAGEAGIAGLGGLGRGRCQMPAHAARAARCRSGRGSPRASAAVVGSGTVGPLAITAGSSPGTSEISSETVRAGKAAAASRPPLMRERCLRTQFISSIEAPERSSALLIALLVGERQALGRQGEQGRAAARDQGEDQIVLAQARRPARGCARPRPGPPRRARGAPPRPPRSAGTARRGRSG